jgi:hypothetical protein
LAGEIATAELHGDASTYYERWLASLEKLVIGRGLMSEAEFAARIAEQALHDSHTHHHHDHHHHTDEAHSHDHHHEHSYDHGHDGHPH